MLINVIKIHHDELMYTLATVTITKQDEFADRIALCVIIGNFAHMHYNIIQHARIQSTFDGISIF